MQNKKLIRIVESFILFPVMTVSGSLGANLPQTGASVISTGEYVLSEKLNIAPLSNIFGRAKEVAIDPEAEIRKIKAEAIDNYFKERDMPLYGTGMKMVIEAENNGLDWRLLAAIAVRESTGGKFECKRVPNNSFGWGSCRIGFESNEHAIETVGRNLGGNNPKTAMHYKDKDTVQILRAYNPPSVVPRYAEQVISIMDAISDQSVVIDNEEAIKDITS